MLKETLLEVLRDLYPDKEAYSDILLSLMDEYGVNNLYSLSYQEMAEFVRRQLYIKTR